MYCYGVTVIGQRGLDRFVEVNMYGYGVAMIVRDCIRRDCRALNGCDARVIGQRGLGGTVTLCLAIVQR